MTAAVLQPFLTYRFNAMACPCEVLLDTTDAALAKSLGAQAESEARRIEAKYSRYRRGNVVDRINSTPGKTLQVDDETALLLDYAAQCFDISDGLFDVTTGILRKIWRFDGTSVTAPNPEALDEVRTRIGWDKIRWERPWLQIPDGMELDFGGICKEYAADRILRLLRAARQVSVVVNLGGDIAVAGERQWAIGIEDIAHAGKATRMIQMAAGGLATSGTTRRFVQLGGKTLGHVLSPKTGWPVVHAPKSVTVAAKSCTEAGFWTTLGMLHGAAAETFLAGAEVEFWCYR